MTTATATATIKIKPIAHETVKCIRDIASTQYVGKGHRSRFMCPTCGRTFWQHLNFLGRRDILCNGIKLVKVSR